MLAAIVGVTITVLFRWLVSDRVFWLVASIFCLVLFALLGEWWVGLTALSSMFFYGQTFPSSPDWGTV